MRVPDRAISSAVEHSLHTGGVAGSIPASPTIFPLRFQLLRGRALPFLPLLDLEHNRKDASKLGKSRGVCSLSVQLTCVAWDGDYRVVSRCDWSARHEVNDNVWGAPRARDLGAGPEPEPAAHRRPGRPRAGNRCRPGSLRSHRPMLFGDLRGLFTPLQVSTYSSASRPSRGHAQASTKSLRFTSERIPPERWAP